MQSKSRLPQVFSSEEPVQVQVLAVLPRLIRFGCHSCRKDKNSSLNSSSPLLFLCLGCLSRMEGECGSRGKARSNPACLALCFLFKVVPCTDLQKKLQEFLHFCLAVLLQALDHSWWMICNCAVFITLIVLEPLKTGGDISGLNSKTRPTFSWITEEDRD